MNKTDRMLAIVLELQRRRSLRAVDLADIFETSVRTIYRDVQALCEAGVPIVGSPGQGYSLVEGYFLPPIGFTAEEAVVLLLGLDFVRRRFDREYRLRADSSRAKIEAVLPGSVRQEAARLRAGWKFLQGEDGGAQTGAVSAHLASLRRAIIEEKTVRFRYIKPSDAVSGDASSADGRGLVREADPYGLVLVGGLWMLVAYCHLRGGIRHFRLSRIRELAVLDRRFRRPESFDLHAYKPVDDRNLIVRVRIRPELAQQVEEAGTFYTERIERLEDGVIVTLRVRHIEEIVRWVLGWGAGVTVLEPESLKQRIFDEAKQMLKCY